MEIKAKLNRNINTEKKENRSYENEENLFKSINEFLEHSEQSIVRLKNITEVDIEKLKENVAKYFCEDLTQFTLEQCFQIFVFFVQRFKIAVEENRKRNENMQKLKSRQMNRLTNNNKDEHDVISLSTIEGTGLNNKIMFRSQDMNTLNNIESKFCSLKRQNSRPNSQEVISNSNCEDVQHSSLIEFLNSTNDCNFNSNGIIGDGNVYGTNFRRIGSGRRSLRGFNNNNNGNFNNTQAENERERVLLKNESSSINTSNTTTAFNRFSPFRQTIKQSDSKESQNVIRTCENLLPKINIEDSDGPNLVGQKSNKNLTNISTINKPKNFLFEFKRKPLNQYIQQLTAIISPSKCVENNDVLHKEFHKLSLSKGGITKMREEYENNKISNETLKKTKGNGTVLMTNKERSSSMKLTKSINCKPFSQRRSASISAMINKENSSSAKEIINVQHSEINNNYYFNKKTSYPVIMVPIEIEKLKADIKNTNCVRNEKIKKKESKSVLNEQLSNGISKTIVKDDGKTTQINNINQQNKTINEKNYSQYKCIQAFRQHSISQSVIQEQKGNLS